MIQVLKEDMCFRTLHSLFCQTKISSDISQSLACVCVRFSKGDFWKSPFKSPFASLLPVIRGIYLKAHRGLAGRLQAVIRIVIDSLN